MQKKKEALHLLQGLEKILLDIDEAIRIIRQTEEAADVVPNLMIGFGIDQVQAEFVAEIKLRNLNREYILNKTQEIAKLRSEIDDLEDLLQKPKRIHRLMISQLQAIAKKYGKPRKTQLLYPEEIPEPEEEPAPEDYAVQFFVTNAGYFKKITPLSLRMGGEQKFKEGDALAQSFEGTNNTELLFFTDRQQVYKAKASEFEDTKASVLGDFLPQKLGFDEDEHLILTVAAGEYVGWVLFFFANGKCAKVPLRTYETKLNRKKLVNAYSGASPLVAARYIREDCEFLAVSSNGRYVLFSTGQLSEKTTRTTAGVGVLTLKGQNTLARAEAYVSGTFVRPEGYRVKNLPAAGCFLKEADKPKE